MRHVDGRALVAHVDDAYAKLRQSVPDRVDGATLQVGDAVDPAGGEEAHHPFGNAAVGVGIVMRGISSGRAPDGAGAARTVAN
jgi:hypothetical protein